MKHWPCVQVVFFHPALPVIKLTSTSCVYFSKGKGLRREAARTMRYTYCPNDEDWYTAATPFPVAFVINRSF